ncbi:MAG: hypothetical protein ACLFUJ_10895 [Phycisphaerae bacterium]
MAEMHEKNLESVLSELAGSSSAQESACRAAAADLEALLREARIATVNGNVEAHRLGEQGQGFAAVVEAFSELIEKIEDSARAVRSAADQAGQVTDGLTGLGQRAAAAAVSPSDPS